MSISKVLKKLGIVISATCVFAIVTPIAMPTSVNMIVSAATVKLNKKTVSLYVGKSTTLTLSGTKEKVKWSSSDEDVAIVSSSGKVKAVGYGEATITAKVGKKSYKCTVYVSVFKAETVSFGNITLELPKDWVSQEVESAAGTHLIAAPSESSQSAITTIINNTLYKGLADDFGSYINGIVTEEYLLNQYKYIYSTAGFTGELTSQNFSQSSEVIDGISVVLTYVEILYEGKPFVQSIIYDICNGTEFVEISVGNIYDTDIDFYSYAQQIASSIIFK